MNYKLGIIIINWNGNNDTIECLNSLSKYIDNFPYKIFLIDNASKEPILEEVLQTYSISIEYIKNETNLGFAEGNNVGLKRIIELNIPFFLLLNNDVEIIDKSTLNMLIFLEENADVGVVGAVNYYYSMQSKIWQAGITNNIKKGKTYSIKSFDKKSTIPIFVDYVPGSSLMGRSELLAMIGLLDANYFAYFEERDWCMRVKKKGYKIAFLPNTAVLHKIGKSSPHIVKFYLRTRNRLYFFRKHNLFRNFILIFFKDVIRNIYLTIKYCEIGGFIFAKACI
ncbi:glycosyltransferase family 2 protein, partial [bacterium]